MSELKSAGKRVEIRKKGAFNIQEIYTALKDTIKTKLKYKFIEQKQESEVKKTGKKIKMIFTGERPVDDFVRFNVQVELLFENINKTKIDGKMLDDGDVKAIFNAKLEFDYKNRWNADPLSKFLLFVYTKFVLRYKIKDVYERKLMEENNAIMDAFKEQVGLLV